MTSSGGCLCGRVRYQVGSYLPSVLACHCSQCARTSGNFAVMTACKSADLLVEASETLSWFQSSPRVRRGFCSHCGSNLFWKADPGDEIYITAGTLDKPTGLRLTEHIFVASKSDFYDITDSLPQKPGW
ncbi:GFA family protein [Methylobacterium sp.]|uniref:GFA family protein n=1 Tax=Methylobacterium sp. TaxID=409 RepID=UPI003B58BBE4